MVRRPPSDITPAQFFETWLPDTYAEVTRDLATPPADVVSNVELTGPGGGQWTIALQGGKLSVTPGKTPGAAITFVQSAADWRAITTGQAEKELGLALPDSTLVSVDSFLVHPALPRLVAGLATVQGTLDLEIVGDNHRTLSSRLVFQGAREPEAAVSIPAATLAEIQAGKTSAPEAFFAGKIQIRGEATLAMQVAMLAMSPG